MLFSGKRGELKKEHAIRQAIDAKDFSKLRQLAISKGGLLNNNLRQRAWPLLLHVNEKNMLTISGKFFNYYFEKNF